MDVVDSLRKVAAALPVANGTSPITVMMVDGSTTIYELCAAAADEITHLRSLAGAVTKGGQTAAETLAPLRHKAPDPHA